MHPNTDRIPVAEVLSTSLLKQSSSIQAFVVVLNFLFLKETLGIYQLVFDAVYTPRKTRLLKEAETAGAITVSGVEMFLRQAIGQFNLFTGKEGAFSVSLLYL